MAVHLERTGDAELWDTLVARHAGVTAFHDWAWLNFQADLLHVKIERLVVHAGGEPVGVFPVARRSGRSPVSPSLPFPFVGPAVPGPVLAATARAFRGWQRKSGLLLARYELGAADAADGTADALRAAGLDVVEDATIAVDTSHGSLDELHAGYTKMRRRAVRRAVRDGGAVRPARPGEFAAVIPQVLAEAYGSHGGRTSPYPAEMGHRFEAWARDKAWVSTWVATVDDELAGAQVMLTGHPTAVLWVGGCLQRFRGVNPNALLYDMSLTAAVEGGHTSLDFSGWVDDDVATYKLAFGGDRRDYLSVKSILGPVAVRRGLQRAKARLGR